jgi:hypothetical protein
MTSVQKGNATNLSELLTIQKVEPVTEPAIKTQPSVTPTEVKLGINECIPSNWRILPTEGGIEATCGSHLFVGSTREFSDMLKAGKYTK